MELIQFFNKLYNDFNDRKIDLVISYMAEDVQWANGMDGGYVYGRDGVRAYWTKQFTMINSKVTPLKIEIENNKAKIKVHQVVHDLSNNLLADEIVEHIFYLKNNKIERFEIEEKSKDS